MKRIYDKLSLVLLMLLSLVIIFGAGASLIISASADDNNVQTVSEQSSWYEIETDGDNITVLLDANIASYKSISKSDLADIKNRLYSAVQNILIEQIFTLNDEYSVSGYAVATYADGTESGSVLPDLDGSMLRKYEKYIRNRLSDPAELDKYLRGEYDILIKYAVAEYIHNEEHPNDDIQEFIQDIVDHVNSIVDEIIENVYTAENFPDYSEQQLEEEKAAAQMRNDQRSEEISQLVDDVNSSGSSTISLADILKALNTVVIRDSKIYQGDSLILSGIRQLIMSLPKPAEIASYTNENMRLDFPVDIDSKFGSVNFTVTVGFKGDCTKIRNFAQFIADHVDVSNKNGTYTIEIKVPEEFTELYYKVLSSEKVPDNIKHAIFSMFDMTPGEILDKATYDQILQFIRSSEFQNIVANLLDADYIKAYFSGFGVDLSNLSDEKIDKLLNGILDYAEKLANNQSIDGLKSFLSGYGITIPAQLEKAAETFLDLLKKIDYERFDAAEIRAFLKDGERVNNFIDKVLSNYDVESVYNSIVSYAEKLLENLPQKVQNGKIINLYDEETNTLGWSGNVSFDLKNVVEKLITVFGGEDSNLGAKVEAILSRVDGNTSFNFNVDVTVTVPDVYKVTYYVADEQAGVGLLPYGADVNFFANVSEYNGQKILAWVADDGTVYPAVDGDGNSAKISMPAKNITLHAVTGFDAEITATDGGQEIEVGNDLYSRAYAQTKEIVLTAKVGGGTGYTEDDLSYEWYKVDAAGNRTFIGEGSTLTLKDVSDTLDCTEFVCVITNETMFGYIEIREEASAEVKITPCQLDLTGAYWDYLDNAPLVESAGVTYEVKLTNVPDVLPDGVELVYTGNAHSLANAGGDPYYATVALNDPNYEITGVVTTLEWYIQSAPPIDEKEYFEAIVEETGTIVRVYDIDGVIPSDAKLVVTLSSSTYDVSVFGLELEKGKEAVIINVYDIRFEGLSGFVGNFVVQIIDDSFTGKDIVIVHVHDGYNQVPVYVQGNTIELNTTNFSDFAVISVQDEEEPPVPPVDDEDEDTHDHWWIWVLLAMIIITLIIIMILLIILLKTERAPIHDNTPPVIIIKREEIAEEVEEEVQELPTPEETPAEETAVAAVEPEPEPELEAEPEVVPEPVEESAIVVEIGDDEEAPIIIDEGRIVFDKSFRARLSQAEDDVKGYYTELKNELLSYKGVKSRISWSSDTFNIGREKCVKLQFRGKSLYMYIALSAAEIPEKYNVEDVSDKIQYEDVPTMFKIRKPRSIKHAKELVAILMEKLGVEQGEIPTDDYRAKYQSTDNLIRQGLVKVRRSRSNFGASKDSDK